MNSLLPLSILLLCFFFFFIQAQFCFSAVVLAVQKHRRQSLLTAETSCDIFTGSWVQDESYPLYYFSSCPVIDPQFNCQLFGRPDSNYLHYRWKPATCELPRSLYFLFSFSHPFNQIFIQCFESYNFSGLMGLIS